MKRMLIAGLAAIAMSAATASAAATVPYLPVPKGAAVILDTGSTNSYGYRIVVQESGAAEFIIGSRRATAAVPFAITGKFFADLRAAMPIASVRIEPCMKSASFGSSLFLWWRGSRSPDVSCPGQPMLEADAHAIAAELFGASYLLKSGPHAIAPLPNEPHMTIPSPAPSPTAAPTTSPVNGSR